jgi:hypothetical protein
LINICQRTANKIATIADIWLRFVLRPLLTPILFIICSFWQDKSFANSGKHFSYNIIVYANFVPLFNDSFARYWLIYVMVLVYFFAAFACFLPFDIRGYLP